MTTTALIFGNQLYRAHPALVGADQVLMIESTRKLAELRWHRKKLIFMLSAMRHYAELLRADGVTVDYYIGAEKFEPALRVHIDKYAVDRLIVVEPSEYAALRAVESWREIFAGVVIDILPDRVGFTCNRADFLDWSAGKGLLLENFYRWQRGRLDILMEGKRPVGARWNFDADNREEAKTLPANTPAPPWFPADTITQAVTAHIAQLEQSGAVAAWGDAADLGWPVTHDAAETWFADFVANRLPQFGPWEDAIDRDNPFLFHSLSSMLLNNGLLTPLACVLAVEKAFREGLCPLQSAEGYIRQVIGWREYVHGVYWREMPSYRANNFFGHHASVPSFFWDGSAKMECLKQTLTTVEQHAWTHHIPRLMILANFGNLAGIDPAALTRWFQSVYIDAYDWVMWPNVIGLGLFADGGLMSTKPYISSAQYIKKMSRGYCDRCHYKPDARTGDQACPFNVLYWDFLARHRDKLAANPRMSIMMSAVAKRADLAALREHAELFFQEWFSPPNESS